jgi:phage gpG-like protein
MLPIVDIKINDELRDGIRALKPTFAMSAVQRGMEKGTALMVGGITKTRLTGQGPFPVSEHRLGVKTGRLRRSFHWTGAGTVRGKECTTQIGVRVAYAAAHEFGFKGTVSVKAHTRKGKKASNRVKAHSRKMNIPERAPIRTGMKQHGGRIPRAIADEIVAELERK